MPVFKAQLNTYLCALYRGKLVDKARLLKVSPRTMAAAVLWRAINGGMLDLMGDADIAAVDGHTLTQQALELLKSGPQYLDELLTKLPIRGTSVIDRLIAAGSVTKVGRGPTAQYMLTSDVLKREVDS